MPEGRYWKPIGPDFGVRNGKLERHPKVFAKAPSASCTACGKCSWGAPKATSKPLTVVTLAGRFDFVRAVFPCGTTGCQGSHEQGSLDAVDLGAWPGTVSECRTMYDEALLDFWDKMSKDQPGASMTALVKDLEGVSRDRGRVGSINRHTMTTAFGEFKMARHSAKYPAALQSGLVCPACWAKQHSCAVDSNRKLYRWARAYDPTRKSYYENIFFYPDEDVQASIKAVDEARGVDRDKPDTACGTGEWKAARDSRSAIRGQDETGCTVCGCRHVFAQRAVNLIQMGERYANAYYLDHHFMQPLEIEFQWQDIICKYWVWRQKTLEAMGHGSGGELQPALNLMHGKLHSWPCQVLFGGQWQDGAAGGAGEDMELLFSYLSRLGVVTKVMGPARRVDVITEAVLHWNEGKARSLARSLVDRYSECRSRTESAVAAFEAACEETLGVPSAEVPDEKLQGWTDEIRKVAAAQLRNSRRPRGSPAVEYFLLKREVESADSLSSYVDSQAFRDSAMCSEALQSLGSVSEELIKGRDKKAKKLRELEKELFPELQGQPVEDEERHILEARSRVALAEETVQFLQEEMESLLHSLEKLRLRVTNEADSSTMRSALRKKEAAVKQQLGKVVDRYNTIVPRVRVEEDLDWQPLTVEDLVSGSELPWMFDRCLDDELEVSPGVHRTLHFKQKYELVEAFNKVIRLREENKLLMREQQSYLSFYTACQDNLEGTIRFWKEHLKDLLEKPEGPVVNSMFEVTMRYTLAESDIASEVDLIRGTMARLWEAHHEAGLQFRKGYHHFQQNAGGLERPWPKRLSDSMRLWAQESDDPFVELDNDEEVYN